MMASRPASTRRDQVILWLATPAGLALVLVTLAGNVAGRAFLPFDRHHFIGLVAGFVLVLWGLMHWK